MAAVGSNKDWEDFWEGIEGPVQQVGIGTLPHQIYASPEYQKKKTKKVLIGSITRVVYAGFEHDPQPTILSFQFEPQYQTILAFNLHYIPPRLRTALLDFVLKTNRLRIKQKKPIIVDYNIMKRAFPWVAPITRRYKIALIGVKENVPLIGWKDVSEEPSKFKGAYKGAGMKK